MSLQVRLTLTIVIMLLVALSINAIINSLISTDHMRSTLREEVEKDLVAKRELIKDEIEFYFSTIEGQITSMAVDEGVIEAAEQLINAFDSYATQRGVSSSSVQLSVQSYYNNQFQTEYRSQNDGSANIQVMTKGLDTESVLLQYDFISNNKFPLGNKDKLYDLENGTLYSELHAKYHETFRYFLQTFGYYDIFIADADSGDIIYSVFKELDYSTSLRTGPYANSGIGEAFQNAVNLPKGDTYLTDFAPYLPSYNNPASFIGTPIHRDGEVVAVLIFQMPIDRINTIMTQESKWVQKGFGDSGEIYLVGQDKTLRNESRFFIEDKDGYIRLLKNRGIKQSAEIDAKDTSISLQPVNTPGASAALNGLTGFDIFDDYRGVSVLSAYGPVKVGQFTWGILSEIDEEEAFAPASQLSAAIWGTSALVTTIMTGVSIFISIVSSKALIKPLVKISDQFQFLTSKDANIDTRISQSNIKEIDKIASGFNVFLEQIRQIIINIKTNADTISTASTQLSATTEQSNSSALSQREDSEKVSDSIHQFNIAIQEVLENSVVASDKTTLAKQSTIENADRAKQTAEGISRLVEELSSSAQTLQILQEEVGNINDVLNVINGIADQTNLLALNAAIEAARAGEHGRGFAVVADEVRQLASRTQKSTVEIQDKIVQLTNVANDSFSSMERASDSAGSGIQLVETVNGSLQNLNKQIMELASINEMMASSAEEQKYTIEEINRNVDHVKESSTELCTASDEIARSAVNLSEIAADMKEQVGRFRT